MKGNLEALAFVGIVLHDPSVSDELLARDVATYP